MRGQRFFPLIVRFGTTDLKVLEHVLVNGEYDVGYGDMKPRLIDRYLGEGGLANPPTPIFTPQHGVATLVSMVSLPGGSFRLVLARGDILPKTDMTRCEMPYIFWKPRSGIEACVEAWIAQGGTHHEVISLGDVSARWKMLCTMWGIECVEV